jgi:hypothetical protein
MPKLLENEPFCQLDARNAGFPSRLKCPQCGRDTRKLRRFGCPRDEASKIDRLWFEQHPDMNEYARPFIEGELPYKSSPQMMTLVTQISPGVRQRHGLLKVDEEPVKPGWYTVNYTEST